MNMIKIELWRLFTFEIWHYLQTHSNIRTFVPALLNTMYNCMWLEQQRQRAARLHHCTACMSGCV